MEKRMKTFKGHEMGTVKDYKELLNRAVEKYGDKVAFKYKKDLKAKNPEYVEHTFKDYKNDVTKLGTALLDMGLEGKKVALIGRNRYEWCVTYMAVACGNMIIVKKIISVYDEINRSIVKRKRKYDRGGKHMKKILKIVVCFIGIMISASTVSASKLEILSESEDYEKIVALADEIVSVTNGGPVEDPFEEGISVSDIDFDNGFVHITKASQYTSEKGIFVKNPKTQSSIREVGIPDIVINMLKKYRTWYEAEKEKCGNLWINSNRLFVTWNGSPMHPDTVTDWFRSFIEKNNLPKITFHGLRHTNATLLISKNVDVAVVASRLGHAQITTTLNFYVHPVQSHNKEAGKVLEKMLV